MPLGTPTAPRTPTPPSTPGGRASGPAYNGVPPKPQMPVPPGAMTAGQVNQYWNGQPPQQVTSGPIPAGMRVPAGSYNQEGGQAYQDALGMTAALNNQIWTNVWNQNAMLGYDRAAGNVGYQYDQRNLALNTNSDLARLANSRYRDVDLANWWAQQQLASAQRGYNTATDMAGRRLGDANFTANGAYGIDMRRLDAQLNAARADRGLGLDRIGVNTGIAQRAATNDGAARGAGTSTGLEQNRTDITDQARLDTRGVNNAWDAANASNVIGRDSTTFQRDAALRNAQTSYDGTMADANNNWVDAQVAKQKADAYIGSIAKDYGVTESQMRQAFELGAQRLGLDYGNLMRRITAQANTNTAQGYAASAAMAQQLLLAAQGG